MTHRPDCGRELSLPDSACPSCKKPVKPPFALRNFLWENFRLFTMVGVTGTMISLIPNMGNRILGDSWITNPESFLPLFLSMIIFFGAVFLTICFLMIFCLVFEDRHTENVRHRFTLRSRTLMSWYEGDSQRSILLFVLVPMWVGLLLFFILLMPLIPNRYSWLFAAVIGLTCIPLAILSFLGWNVGKKITGMIPGLDKFPRLSLMVFTLLVIGFIVLVPLTITHFSENAGTVSSDVQIRTDPQYFSPYISSEQGLRLEITNVSGRTLQESRHTWSADYGYFIRVIPSTGKVTILGNPVSDDNARDMYWTYSEDGPEQDKKPVKIALHIYPLQGQEEIANASVYLTWYTPDIAYVNRSYPLSL